MRRTGYRAAHLNTFQFFAPAKELQHKTLLLLFGKKVIVVKKVKLCCNVENHGFYLQSSFTGDIVPRLVE